MQLPVTDKWTIAGSTQVRFRSSRTTLCVLGLLCILIATGVVLNCRIHRLESKNISLEEKLESVTRKLGCLMAKITNLDLQPEILSKSVDCAEFNKQFALLSTQVSPGPSPSRIRRSVDYQGQAQPQQSLTTNGPPAWNASSLPFSQPLAPGHHRKSQRGSRDKRNGSKKSTSSLFKELLHLRTLHDKDKSSLAKLKIKLETAKERAKSAKSLLSAYRNRSQQFVENSRNFSTGTPITLSAFFCLQCTFYLQVAICNFILVL